MGTTISSASAIAKLGIPSTINEGKYMQILNVPADLQLGVFPPKIYCNKLIADKLIAAFTNIRDRKLEKHLKTYDGCYCLRKQRGSISAYSMHSWGLAIDINASENGLGMEPKINKKLVECFTDAGFEWGGNWVRKDGMHFQLAAF